jgi:hypothetical protein
MSFEPKHELNWVLAAATNSARTNEARSRLSYLTFTHYCEPGYGDKPVVLGNWNDTGHWSREANRWVSEDDTLPRLGRVLERLGYELDWHDEYVICDQCGGAFRTSPDSYGWQCSGSMDEDGCWCRDCLDPGQHLAALEGQDVRCNTISSIDPGECGYKRIDLSFEHGWYGGQAADPHAIGKLLTEAGIARYIFNIDSTGQFDMAFSVWVHESEDFELATETLRAGDTDAPEDPADVMARGLKAAQEQAQELQGPGVKYTKITGDQAETRLVSPEEFIDGIKD